MILDLPATPGLNHPVGKIVIGLNGYPYTLIGDLNNEGKLQSGGALKSITKGIDGWWECDTPVGKAKIETVPNREFGILDHIFVGRKSQLLIVYLVLRLRYFW